MHNETVKTPSKSNRSFSCKAPPKPEFGLQWEFCANHRVFGIGKALLARLYKSKSVYN